MRRDQAKAAAGPPATSGFETDPEKLAVVLLSYARRCAGTSGWRDCDRMLARGNGVEDLVQDAMASLSGGELKRRWDPQKHPDPMQHLKWFVRSRMSTLARSYDALNVRRGDDSDEHADPETPESLVLQVAERKERDAWRAQARDLLLAEIIDDDLLVRLHDLMETEEIDKPAELATRLNVSLEEIKNAKKRFRRAWERVVAAMSTNAAQRTGGTV